LETISTLSARMENTLKAISLELLNMSRNLDGNLRDIGNGTHIKIPMDAGYVNFYRLPNSYEITCWMKLDIQDNLTIKSQHKQNLISDKVQGALS